MKNTDINENPQLRQNAVISRCDELFQELSEALTWYFVGAGDKYFEKFEVILKENFKQKEKLSKWILDDLEIKPQSFVNIAYNRFSKRL